MAFNLKHIKNLKALEISLNGKTLPRTYSQFMNYLESLERVQQTSEFSWLIEESEIDVFISKFGYHTCMTETVKSINGTEVPIVPEFIINNKYLDEMILEPFPFQKVGISFLREKKRAILGDSMGLGKTPQAIGASFQLLKEKKVNKILVVVPASLKYQWKDELLKFIDMESVVIDGTLTKRKKIYKTINDSNIHFYIIGYQTVRNDIDIILDLDLDVMILDEAHQLKNRATKLYKAIIQLNPKYKFALTGTPMQNKPEEVFALMSWINPNILGKVTPFRKNHIVIGEKFGKKFVELGYKNLDEIKEKISPIILRRMKEDVAPDLPEIIHSKVFVNMNGPQEVLYKEISDDLSLLQTEIKEFYENNQAKSEDDSKNIKFEKEDAVLGYLYMMQAISDHPYLLLNGKSKMAKKYSPLIKKCRSSPKLDELINIMSPLREQGSKIIIFTQYARMLELIKERIISTFSETPYIIHGGIDSKNRQEQVVEFSSDASVSNFMILTDAGNFGLNIQAADTLINYDSNWNPAIMDQRTGRIHRIGSTHNVVNVIDMITLDTIDESIQKTLKEKTLLNKGIVEKSAVEIQLLQDMIQK